MMSNFSCLLYAGKLEGFNQKNKQHMHLSQLTFPTELTREK